MRFLLPLLFPFQLFGALHYVDNAASGTDTGASWVNAFRSFNQLSNSFVANAIAPGDTVYISGGTTSKTYNNWLWVGDSGTAGNLITISTSVEAGHSGNVIIDGQNVDSQFGGITCGSSYVKVTGLPNTNLHVVNWGTNAVNREVGIAVYCGIPTYVIMEGILISNVNNGFYFTVPGEWNEVRYCHLKAIGGDYAFRYTGGGGPTATNFMAMYIHHCYAQLNADFTGGGRGGPDGVGGGSGITLHDCVFRCLNGSVSIGQHPDGIQSLGNYVRVYNNYFANFLNAGVKLGPEPPSYIWNDTYVYNNVITADDPTFVAMASNNGKGMELGTVFTISNVFNVVIANNTLIDLVGLAINGGTGTYDPIQSFWLVNNLIVNCSSENTNSATAAGPTNANTVIDYNLVNKGGFGSPILGVATNGAVAIYPPFIQSHHLTGLPVFVNYTAYSPNNDFRLSQSDTAAVGQGTNLSAFFTTDFNGVTRVRWDIGAYQAPDDLTFTRGTPGIRGIRLQ